MKLSFLKYILLFISTGLFYPCAFAQKEIGDTVAATSLSPASKADDVYFNAVKAKMLDDTARARQQFEAFVIDKPNVSDAYYELARLYHANKNTDRAEEDIKKAIDLDNSNKWYKEEFASILGDKTDYAGAAKIMASLSDSEPEDPNYPIIAAEYYEHAQMFKEAITYLDKALAIGGPDEDLQMQKVQTYLDMNKVNDAAGVVEQMIAGDPKNGKYYKELGDIYDNNKMPDKATQVYKRAVKTIPDDPAVQLGLAEHYLVLGDTASYFTYVRIAVINKRLDAETQLDVLRTYIQSLPNNNDSVLKAQCIPVIWELVAQHPADAQVLAFYGELLELNNQRDSAMIEFKLSLAYTPSNFNLWTKVLESYTGRQDADSLIKYSEKAIRLFPTQAVTYFYNGIGYYNKKETDKAIKSLKRAIEFEPETKPDVLATMYATLADIYHETKQDALSDAAYESSLKFQPDDAVVLNNYSYYLSERGQKLAEAEKMSKRSLALKPGEATFMDTYGWILYQTGDYTNAKTYIQKAIDMAGTKVDATLYDHLGDVYYKLKDKDKAIQNWKLAKEKGAEDPKIDKKISEGKLYE